MNAALVLGLSIHGLAVCRALSRRGIRTYAIAAEQSPATRTKYAKVEINRAVNSKNIAALLEEVGPKLAVRSKVVLLPTNDTMVREIGAAWNTLQNWFLISWSDSIQTVLTLQRKDRLPEIATAAGLCHPKSVVVSISEDVRRVSTEIGYPCIVKPSIPLSGFKVRIVACADEFMSNLPNWANDLPLVAQELIEGRDTELYFYSGLWHGGKEVCAFSGRKLRSLPAGMGQGTALEGLVDDQVAILGRQFAEATAIAGPLAVEFKREPGGKLIMIEPNVGRTEYCVDLLIQSGCNLPFMEYMAAVNKLSAQPKLSIDSKMSRRTWYDTERDPLVYVRDCVSHRSIFPRGTKPIFPYFGHNDPFPLIASVAGETGKKMRGLLKRLVRMKRPPKTFPELG